MPGQAKREVVLVRTEYQTGKAELEEPIAFSEGTTAEDLARALTQLAELRWKPRPE